jgi:hypothetical protein
MSSVVEMAAHTTYRPSLTFGIEVELLVKPKITAKAYATILKHHYDPKLKPVHGKVSDEQRLLEDRNRTAIRHALAEEMTVAGSKAKLEGPGYTTWYVKKEGSLSEVADERGGAYCKLCS